ncbi:MAG: hypothetical protein AABX13_05350 [Nanoarchaeota archaeon]
MPCRQVLFALDYPREKKGYMQIRRLIFGRDEPEYQEKGMVAALQGQKISSQVNFSMKEIILLES